MEITNISLFWIWKNHIPQSFWDVIIYFRIISVFLVVWFRKSANISPWLASLPCLLPWHRKNPACAWLHRWAASCVAWQSLQPSPSAIQALPEGGGKSRRRFQERWNGFQHLVLVMEFYRKKRLESQRIWMKLLYKPWTCLQWMCNDNWLGNWMVWILEICDRKKTHFHWNLGCIVSASFGEKHFLWNLWIVQPICKKTPSAKATVRMKSWG